MTGPYWSGRNSFGNCFRALREQLCIYLDHFASGTELFRAICHRDMEGVVVKQASATYRPEATTWVKIKNRQYSQAVGREEFFDRPKASFQN